ncbi:hypothetical protein FSP39_009347 [Pinctada imbricata]|uniref:Uncharacterized protein n=1 Tax=Pinctada imbricata TaxID=66713 RepID=A0AA88XGN3_PINIB|nr:hypothetical protein FSP39_009347 [Pinctada imbricata]
MSNLVNHSTITVKSKKKEACRIPQIDPLHEEYRHLIQPKEIIRCDDIISLTYKNGSYIFVNNTAKLKLGLSKNFSHCVYNEIYRPRKGKDHNYYQHLNSSVTFKAFTKVNSEFVRVLCYNYHKEVIHKNFFAFVPKIHTRGTNSCGVKKPNVVLLGVDSTSRWNSMRYLPETRRLLKDVGAIEMTGYSAVGHNTFENMVPLLTGKSADELGWNDTKKGKLFDEFDIIWKEFKKEGYKTLFIEDTPDYGMFDYGKDGFRDFPTDFFNRHLFVAISRETLIAILGKTSTKDNPGIDLLTPVPRGRNCDDAGIPRDCCPCKTREEIPLTPILRQIAEITCVGKINSILEAYADKCVNVQLQNISEAYSVINTHYKDVKEFVFSTAPGNAKFQVQVRKTTNNFQIIGDITRINRYNDQSHCVQDYIVKNYCFCKDKLMSSN